MTSQKPETTSPETKMDTEPPWKQREARLRVRRIHRRAVVLTHPGEGPAHGASGQPVPQRPQTSQFEDLVFTNASAWPVGTVEYECHLTKLPQPLTADQYVGVLAPQDQWVSMPIPPTAEVMGLRMRVALLDRPDLPPFEWECELEGGVEAPERIVRVDARVEGPPEALELLGTLEVQILGGPRVAIPL